MLLGDRVERTLDDIEIEPYIAIFSWWLLIREGQQARHQISYFIPTAHATAAATC